MRFAIESINSPAITQLVDFFSSVKLRLSLNELEIYTATNLYRSVAEASKTRMQDVSNLIHLGFESTALPEKQSILN